ncbi:hypothetical protein PR048_027555 [Dryococelus australis]|uniref:Uncharacterized protein n=1 Tax=Dryococelus australis TaxID=614101 RepID=A0ABQ9GGV1_9NEOP|nr:hypothetical protein PR048_027555 [Dryococelus australis]
MTTTPTCRDRTDPSQCFRGRKRGLVHLRLAPYPNIVTVHLSTRAKRRLVAEHQTCGKFIILHVLAKFNSDGVIFWTQVFRQLRAIFGRLLTSSEARMEQRQAGENGRSPRKPADQWHCPARFPHAKIWGVTPPGIEPGSLCEGVPRPSRHHDPVSELVRDPLTVATGARRPGGESPNCPESDAPPLEMRRADL